MNSRITLRVCVWNGPKPVGYGGRGEGGGFLVDVVLFCHLTTMAHREKREYGAPARHISYDHKNQEMSEDWKDMFNPVSRGHQPRPLFFVPCACRHRTAPCPSCYRYRYRFRFRFRCRFYFGSSCAVFFLMLMGPLGAECSKTFLSSCHVTSCHQGGVGRQFLRGLVAPAPVPQGRGIRRNPNQPPEAPGLRSAGGHSRGHQQQPSSGHLGRDGLREDDSGQMTHMRHET